MTVRFNNVSNAEFQLFNYFNQGTWANLTSVVTPGSRFYLTA